MRRKRRSTFLAAVFALLPGLAIGLPSAAYAVPVSQTTTAQPSGGTSGQQGAPSGSSKVTDPDSSLPKGWKSSGDRAVTTSGDQTGLHVLVADSGQSYQWRTVATLSEPIAADLWIGNACVTASGKRAAVVYAPRGFTNTPDLMQRGAFAAIVDPETGAVTKLPAQVSLAYFNPGCGAGEDVVFTQGGDTDLGQTRLLRFDASNGKQLTATTVPGQLTSAVPVKGGVVAAAGAHLERIDNAGNSQILATTSRPAFSIHPDAEGGITYMDTDGTTSTAKRLSQNRVVELAHGKLGSLNLTAGGGGTVFLTGRPDAVSALPTVVKRLGVGSDVQVSTEGALVIDQATSARVRAMASNPLDPPVDGVRGPVQIDTEVPATGKKLTFSLTADSPASSSGQLTSPALANAQGTQATGGKAAPNAKAGSTTTSSAAGSATSTIDDDRGCSIPRNDPTQQAYQPTGGQVEWAADMAIRGDLTSSWVRQGGWRTLEGLGTVDPQGMFPLPALSGGGRIPAQVLLGVLAQESNLWQAEGGAIPGQFSNPLTGNFYGLPTSSNAPDPWLIDWTKVDCGYGIGQQTDGMHGPNQLRPGDVVWPANWQKAVALDYTSNIAVAAQTLANKWNELQDPLGSVKINNNDPSVIENWFAAVWAYNAGFNEYQPGNPSAPWGLGYLNNPANPIYPPTRTPFLDGNHYADAAHPQNWPYEEKVMGWAAWPIDTGRSYDDNGNLNHGSTAGYAAAWWLTSGDRTLIKPSLDTFCNAANNCDVMAPPGCELNHVGDPSCDTPYWWHSTATWKDCSTGTCGHETLTYKTLRTEPGNGATGAPDCRAVGSGGDTPPAGSLIIDSVSGATPPLRPGCTVSWTDAGTLSFNFQPDTNGNYEAKADLHQIGGGFDDHFWYTHTRGWQDPDPNSTNPNPSFVQTTASDLSVDPPRPTGPMAITGTWQLNRPINAWTRVFVHLPDSGSQTQQAIYTIHLGDGTTENRTLDVYSSSNRWVSLGVFNFVAGSDIQGVELSNYTQDGIGAGGEDIAWDATAFQPLPNKPKDFVVQMGDSYSSGEGAQPYLDGTDVGPYANLNTQTSPGRSWDACRRSQNSLIRLTTLPGRSATIGTLADSNDNSLDYHSTACSGAFTYNVGSAGAADSKFPSARGWGVIGQHHEVPQLTAGFLDANTTLVELTAGGNDAGFSNVIQACAELGCPDDSKVKSGITAIQQPLQQLLEAIKAKAPHAKIVLLGYPEIFDQPLVGLSCSVMRPAPAGQLNGYSDLMRDTQQQAAAAAQADGTPVTFYWPNTEFANARICDTGAGINDLVAAPSTTSGADFSCPGSVLPCPSMESYHPNNTGTRLYAKALQNALAAAGY
ncbi:SGNH/GDSL hydrolase family protein [Kitasatospora acidiphila]|uniref:SGNH/GDSL hydrolase family protein n=1 Tax=Kitasatospora acidiphila TaxID=2567942 RepID=A0A540W4U6_9ACTN|nr:SGNH/GDSL hydrolase family protein [Kitasatospora acidiphila]TQF04048.1 SGNH/GDSL hydrolase family protein [Kitasatospora acidiphila]